MVGRREEESEACAEGRRRGIGVAEYRSSGGVKTERRACELP